MPRGISASNARKGRVCVALVEEVPGFRGDQGRCPSFADQTSRHTLTAHGSGCGRSSFGTCYLEAGDSRIDLLLTAFAAYSHSIYKNDSKLRSWLIS